MNFKITSISKQAAEYADDHALDHGGFYPCYTEKFVELIVKECGKFADPTTRKLMANHFGVTE